MMLFIKTRIDQITTSDPTPNKEYTNWLVREVLNKRMRLPEDAGIIQSDILFFHDLKRRNQLRRFGVESNIDKYMRHQFQDMVQGLREKQAGTSKRQELEGIKAQGAEKLYQGQPWTVIKATTEEACVVYGKGTRWCTASKDNSMANSYLKDGPIYIILNNKEPYAQLHTATNQFMDVRDAEIDLNDVPDDLKDILFSVIPKETEKDHVFFYKLTGKLDPTARKEAEYGTEKLSSGPGYQYLKFTNKIATLLNNKDIPEEYFSAVNPENPIWAFLTDNKNYFWQFNLKDTWNIGTLVTPKGQWWKHISLGKEESNLPKEICKIINNNTVPQSPKEAICLFYLTELHNHNSDTILLNYLKNLDWESIKIKEYNTKDMMFNIWKYFREHQGNQEFFQVIKDKIHEVIAEIQAKNKEFDDLAKKADSPAYEKLIRRHAKVFASDDKTTYLDEILGQIGARNPSPQVMKDVVELAKHGKFWALWNFWTLSMKYNKKNPDHYEDEEPIYGKFPWGTNGWQEAEPYLAYWAAKTQQGQNWHSLIDGYASMTPDKSATLSTSRTKNIPRKI